jgi:transposase InsO family protein
VKKDSIHGKINVQKACKIMGYTRQAFYKQVEPDATVELKQEYLASILPDLKRARRANPTKGCRAMYEQYGKDWSLGRDKTLDILLRMGFRVKYHKRYGRATQSGTREFPNLLVNKQIDGINQVWQADMAFYLFAQKPLYTIYITDVYSQEVVGYGAFSTNEAINYAQVLEGSIRHQTTFTNGLCNLIHHSDGGKQYESKVYKLLCNKHKITQSMCMFSYENPYAEKTNDLINNGYLNVWKPTCLNTLRQCQQKAVNDHNQNSRKKKLGNLSPLDFKKIVLSQIQGSVPYFLNLKPVEPVQPKRRISTLIK